MRFLRFLKTQIFKNQEGFTILELLAVVVMLGILAIVFFPQIKGREDSARMQAVESQIYRIWESARIWRVNNGYMNYNSFTDINTLINAGLMTAQEKTSAFGTDYTVTKATGTPSMGITVQVDINSNTNCQSIATRFTNKGYTASCTGNKLSVTLLEG